MASRPRACYRPSMRPRVVLVVAVAACALIGGIALFSPSGLARLNRLDEEEAALKADVERRTSENETLAEEIELLRGDTAASNNVLEKRAREELGYIRPGEVLLTVPVPVDAAPATGEQP